jgi:hypothetical protein
MVIGLTSIGCVTDRGMIAEENDTTTGLYIEQTME